MADNLKALAKRRVMEEMLQGVRNASEEEWSVLVLDSVTMRVLSSICKVSDTLDYGVSLVENVTKKREPLPEMAGIYFLSPSEASVRSLVNDFRGRALYGSVHVFFSSSPSSVVLASIKACTGLTPRLKTLKVVNLEYVIIDQRSFITDEPRALETLFGEGTEDSAQYNLEVATVAARLATFFTSIREFPAIRFRAPKPGEEGAINLGVRALVTQRIALELHERLQQQAQQPGALLPLSDTCELIIVDRGFDVVSPIIHEWTYEAMIYDLLDLQGHVFRYEIETGANKRETREAVLDERDTLWQELRHKHYADASEQIAHLLDDFRAKYSSVTGRSADSGTRGLKALTQALPQYQEQLARLNVHVELATQLKDAINDALVDLGRLEQDLVFGDATSKEVIGFFTNHLDMAVDAKVRLLMCYAATHPEKLDSQKQGQWQKLARMTDEDMLAVTNLENLGIPVLKRAKSSGLAFGRKRKRTVRKDREGGENEEQWLLSRYTPLLQELGEDMVKGTLSTEVYPYVSVPASNGLAVQPSGASVSSVRSTRKTTWARKGVAVEREDPGQKAGRRVILFVVGGVTWSEIRSAHRLTAKLGRSVVVGGTSVEAPVPFLKRLQALRPPENGDSRGFDGSGEGFR